MPKTFQYLSKATINTLLPHNLRIKEKKYSGNIYSTEDEELIGYTESKYYECNELFYSLFIDLLKEYKVKNVCLTIFNKGVLPLPLSILSGTRALYRSHPVFRLFKNIVSEIFE